jgi:hypothetical protein
LSDTVYSTSLPAKGLHLTTYSDIARLLDASIGGPDVDIGAHGAFWRTLSRDQFVTYQVFGSVALLSRDDAGQFDPDNSTLVMALEGRAPFGRDVGVPGARYPRMPAGFPPMSSDDIRTIRGWISSGCPA